MTTRAEMINVLASAICRWHDPNLTDRLTPTMTAKEAACHVEHEAFSE